MGLKFTESPKIFENLSVQTSLRQIDQDYILTSSQVLCVLVVQGLHRSSKQGTMPYLTTKNKKL